MKGNRIVLAVFFCSLAPLSLEAVDRPRDGNLEAVVATVGQILEQAEYTQHKLDTSMGKQILETYLKSLDLNKLFFTQEDIDHIRNEYGSSLGDDILLGNWTPAKSIFAIFRQRADERVAKISELLKARYNFDSDRTFILDRGEGRWPLNASEADGVWKDRIENELLAAKLSEDELAHGPEAIERRYRELRGQIDRQDDEGVLRIFLEAVAQTYDPHSEYLGPSELNQFRIDTQLTISGVGAEIRMKNGCATIVRVFSRGPAGRSGRLHVGDKIIGVAEGNGPFVNVLHSDLDEITEKVLGKSGSIVRLQFLSSRAKSPSDLQVVSLVREEVRLTEEAATAELVEMDLPGGVQKLGWVTVPSFYGDPDNSTGGTSVTHDVATLLGRLVREGIQGLVIDLRDNGGGSVAEAVRMAGLFINHGPIAQLKDSNDEIHVVREHPDKALYEGPTVVLDNKLTASASEIFSAAMQDHRRAAIVGDSSTFGKGTVQAVIELNRFIEQLGNLPHLGGALKITIEKIYRVTGDSTQVKGVISDLIIPSLTETAVQGENTQEHRLPYDSVAPVALDDSAVNSLFLDKLRSRSIARIQENPLFRDLISEITLANENRENNRVSLNKKIRRNELSEKSRLRKKADFDRRIARANDRNKYYQLLLDRDDKTELKPINNRRGESASEQTATPDSGPEFFPDAPPGLQGKANFDGLTDSDAITRETLNILSDLVNLTKARQTATSHVEKKGPG
jgi:carboxyl-terminal processing protease